LVYHRESLCSNVIAESNVVVGFELKEPKPEFASLLRREFRQLLEDFV
jgi:hypothetical protein